MIRFVFKKAAVLSILCAALLYPQAGLAASDDYHIVGILAGLSFPKGLVGKLDLNFAKHWGLDYQNSISLFWTIQQGDVIYYFNRSDWSGYIGAGLQSWNFYGVSGSTNYNGILFGVGSSAVTVSLSMGLIYVAPSGFAVDLNVAGEEFVNASLDLKNRVVPEGTLCLGYFF